MSRDSDTMTALWLLAAIAVVAYRRHIAYWLGIGLVMLLLTSLLLGWNHSYRTALSMAPDRTRLASGITTPHNI